MPPKKITDDTDWKVTPIPPRHSPFPETRPCPSGWQWRTLSLKTQGGVQYQLHFEVDARRGRWKAWFILLSTGGRQVLVRFEDQPGKGGGIHLHSNCDPEGTSAGADSLDMRYTLPDHGRRRRRRNAMTPALFCQLAGRFFRTDPVTGQEDMSL